MMVQQRSLTFHKGEPESHKLAVYRVMGVFNVLGKNGYNIIENFPLEYTDEFKKQLPSNRTFLGHNADLCIFDWVVDMNEPKPFDINKPTKRLRAVIEVHGDVGFWYFGFNGKKKKGTATKHSKKSQQRNDKIVSNWCEQNDVQYIVLKKEEILGDCTQDGYIQRSFDYIKENLKEFLK